MSGKQGDVSNRRRQDRLLREQIHDPYLTRSKPVEPTVCPQCGVVFTSGRWQWQSSPPAGAREGLCPACQRLRDKVPAGFLTLSGEFFTQHRDEIMHRVQNKVEEQKARHPMKRLMSVDDQADGSVLITFTDVHLPRGVGQAVQRAYEGELEIQYAEGTELLRVYWRR